MSDEGSEPDPENQEGAESEPDEPEESIKAPVETEPEAPPPPKLDPLTQVMRINRDLDMMNQNIHNAQYGAYRSTQPLGSTYAPASTLGGTFQRSTFDPLPGLGSTLTAPLASPLPPAPQPTYEPLLSTPLYQPYYPQTYQPLASSYPAQQLAPAPIPSIPQHQFPYTTPYSAPYQSPQQQVPPTPHFAERYSPHKPRSWAHDRVPSSSDYDEPNRAIGGYDREFDPERRYRPRHEHPLDYNRPRSAFKHQIKRPRAHSQQRTVRFDRPKPQPRLLNDLSRNEMNLERATRTLFY